MFRLTSEYSPRGDQPQAIATLTGFVREGRRHVVLRGVTGLANMTREEAPPGPPLGSTAPVGVATVPTEDAFSVPKWNTALSE